MFVILEGLDRSGKSTVADHYKSKGYEVVHMSAPDKKYSEDGYVGPSYLDEMMDLCSKYDGKDVIFDRSWYGELVWPHVYDRTPMLDEEAFEILKEYEDRNQVERILMIDPDKEAHWRRCVDNNEDLTRRQFATANTLYQKLIDHGFFPRQLSDFKIDKIEEGSSDRGEPGETVLDAGDSVETKDLLTKDMLPEQTVLEKANAINSILTKKILKQKGDIFERIESDLRGFLQVQLKQLLAQETPESFSSEETVILKMFCKSLKEKNARK